MISGVFGVEIRWFLIGIWCFDDGDEWEMVSFIGATEVDIE